MPRLPFVVPALLVAAALLCVPAAAAQTAPAAAPAPPTPLRVALLHGALLHGAPAPSAEPLPGGAAFTRRRSPWLGFDKVQHLTFSLLWTLGGQYTFVNKAGLSEGRAWPLSAGLSAAVGVAKEVYDWRIGARRDFDTRDLVADAVGIALASALIAL